jgi:hypothetical protein
VLVVIALIIAECLEPAVVRALNDIWVELAGAFVIAFLYLFRLFVSTVND